MSIETIEATLAARPSTSEARRQNRVMPVEVDYHPLPDLLNMSAGEILETYRLSQRQDFRATFARLRGQDRNLADCFSPLDRYIDIYPDQTLRRQLNVDALENLFERMHSHVLDHPVWVHPFFERLSEGEFDRAQLQLFACHYFNQVKNTRQCVALALGRFHSLVGSGGGNLNIVLSELTQVVLAGLLADEYGVSAHGHEEKPGAAQPGIDIGALFAPVTHAALYRRFLDGIGIELQAQDVPMLHGVADNILVQRIVAGDPSYSDLEALGSVGLGMEWGVPAFFSMIIAGILKHARRTGLALTPRMMEIWSAHVRQDVEHAVSVMVVTSFHIRGEEGIAALQEATNTLMAFRYEMMSDIYERVVDDPCPRIDTIDLPAKYRLRTRRIEPALARARGGLRASGVEDHAAYVAARACPTIFE